jgi:hypothetical protein
LYKSDRRFKDFDRENDEIKDPRFAYLQNIDYSNYSLLNKTAVAVAEAIKRYSLPIESINLTNNGLKYKECIELIDSL